MQYLLESIARKLQGRATAQPATDAVAKPTYGARFEKKARSGSGKKTRSPERGKKAGSKKGAKEAGRSRAKPFGERDPRLPIPGSSLIREWHKKRYVVTVEPDGFTYAGKRSARCRRWRKRSAARS